MLLESKYYILQKYTHVIRKLVLHSTKIYTCYKKASTTLQKIYKFYKKASSTLYKNIHLYRKACTTLYKNIHML